MAEIAAALLPGLAEASPISFQNLSGLGMRQAVNGGSFAHNFASQMHFDLDNSRATNAMNLDNQRFNNSQTMQSNSFNQQNRMMLNNDELSRQRDALNFNQQRDIEALRNNYASSLQSQKLKGDLIMQGAKTGSNIVSQGFGLLGNYLNYTYNSKLQDQAYSNQLKFFNQSTDKMASIYEKSGMPAWAAFNSGAMSGAVPHQTQVLSGLNARTSRLPGAQTQVFTNTGSQNTLGLGVVDN
uniref:VP2 n=1 Tax=Suncus murinus ribovirus 1 TaxID=3139575 RepID=A0AB38ZKE3_9VIRU